jgi:hypothetical protein
MYFSFPILVMCSASKFLYTTNVGKRLQIMKPFSISYSSGFHVSRSKYRPSVCSFLTVRGGFKCAHMCKKNGKIIALYFSNLTLQRPFGKTCNNFDTEQVVCISTEAACCIESVCMWFSCDVFNVGCWDSHYAACFADFINDWFSSTWTMCRLVWYAQFLR